MSYGVGDIVECVDDAPHRKLNLKLLVKRALYTIHSISSRNEVHLSEVSAPGVFGNIYWYPARFRPLRSEELDVFRAMLKPVGVLERV